jgi:hypothetical protein
MHAYIRSQATPAALEKVKAMAMKNIVDEDENVRSITASVLGY